MSIAYRPEIDGLRALAVTAVLLCHADFSLFGGGFVGVDVFFVISGFLITSLIVEDLRQGRFSFINFWERRIRRILPPLFAVFIVTLMAGWVLHLPSDYKNLGQQVTAQTMFASNVLFKSQAGYFEEASIIKPLLHTWSLSVEEQFYFFFPVAFVFLWRRKHQHLDRYLFGVAFVSCVWAAIIVNNSPSSAFYLLPFRAWELLLGSLLALQAKPSAFPRFSKEAMGIAGLALIFGSILLCTEKTMFPWVALPSCLGTALIILSNQNGLNIAGRLLSLRPVVFVGLISYSLYLWHWPIISFMRYSEFVAFTPLVATGCLAAAFILAVLSWKFIETPVRRKIIFPTTRQAYLAAFSGLALFGLTGLVMNFTNGLPSRLDPAVVQYAAGVEDTNPHRKECDKPKAARFEKNTLCQTNPDSGEKPSFILWGDSFADAMAPAFYDLSEKYGKNGFVITAHGCMPSIDGEKRSEHEFDCKGHNAHVLELIEKNDIRNIFMISNWTENISRNKNADFKLIQTLIYNSIETLRQQGRHVYVMLDVPYAPFDPSRYLAFRKLYNREYLPSDFSSESYFAERERKLRPLIAQLDKKAVTIIDPAPMVCDNGRCIIEKDGISLYYNEGHFSKQGALYMSPLFEPYFKKDF